MNSRNRRWDTWSISGVLTGVMAALAALQAPVAVAQPGAASSVTAQWQAHELRFHYFGLTTFYTCTGLEDRLEYILRQLGAHPDVRVSVTGCAGIYDLSNSQIARIRVRIPSAAADAGGESFAATREVVRLKSQHTGRDADGACELLEQVRDQVLPALKMSVVKDDLHCVPGQPSHIGRSLQVQTLVAADGK